MVVLLWLLENRLYYSAALMMASDTRAATLTRQGKCKFVTCFNTVPLAGAVKSDKKPLRVIKGRTDAV
jgi:hypothetical protein